MREQGSSWANECVPSLPYWRRKLAMFESALAKATLTCTLLSPNLNTLPIITPDLFGLKLGTWLSDPFGNMSSFSETPLTVIRAKKTETTGYVARDSCRVLSVTFWVQRSNSIFLSQVTWKYLLSTSMILLSFPSTFRFISISWSSLCTVLVFSNSERLYRYKVKKPPCQ